MKTLDIVALVQNTPLVKLSNMDYQSVIVDKINKKFKEHDQIMFVVNFYSYLNYDQYKDFVVKLDDIWKWIGFGRKGDAKNLLINNFTENVDYKIEKDGLNFAFSQEKAKTSDEKNKKTIKNDEKTASANAEAVYEVKNGGQNAENILLTIRCFKKLCLKAKTKKSDEIHDYYLNLEDLMNEITYEQSTVLKNQLLDKDKEIISVKERTLLNAYSEKPVIYIGRTEENVVKFGFSNDIKTRINTHKSQIGKHFILEYVIESIYNREIENMIKNNLKDHIISKEYNGKVQTELIQLSDILSIEKLNDIVLIYRDSFKNGEMIIKLLDENEKMKKEISDLKQNVEPDIDGTHIYICKTNKVDEYEINVTNEPDKYNDIYKTPHAKRIMKMINSLLDICRVNINIFEMPYDKIKTVVEYCIVAYDNYKIYKNDSYKINYVYNYVTRFQNDLTLIQNIKELIPTSVYETYMSERIETGECYKSAVIMLYDDFSEWYNKNKNINKYKIDINTVPERELKEDIAKNFTKITNIEKSMLNMFDKVKNKKLSSYPGFVGFRIKEDKDFLYTYNIYKEFASKYITYTGNKVDMTHRVNSMDLFIEWLKTTEYKTHQNSVKSSRYKLCFINEFTSNIKQIFDIEYYGDARARVNGEHIHGFFKGIKINNLCI